MNPQLSLPIRTSRLALREFLASDLEAVAAYSADAELMRAAGHEQRSGEETRAYLRLLVQKQADRPRRSWELAVVTREDDRLIGACRLTMLGTREADLGFVLAREEWGRGYATELVGALIRKGFEQLALHRVIALSDVRNTVSLRVLEKSGFTHEATVYGYRQGRGRRRDLHQYVVERDVWLRGRALTA